MKKSEKLLKLSVFICFSIGVRFTRAPRGLIYRLSNRGYFDSNQVTNNRKVVETTLKWKIDLSITYVTK